MKSRVLLIRPPTVMKGTSFIASQFPINLAGIAAVLLREGYDVRIKDFDVEPFSEQSVVSMLNDFLPVVVGLSAYTPTVINAHRIASIVKKHAPSATVLVGGPHISALPEATMAEFPSFDIGVIGEGEDTLIELLRVLPGAGGLEHVDGLIYREGGVLRKTAKREHIKDLDSLPIPARHLLNMAAYKGQSHRGFSRSFLKITEIMTSRGCPNRCIFCASDVVMDKGVRFRSSASVNREISECVDTYGFNHFTISDDTFTLKEDRVCDICEEFSKRGVTWNCNARVWPLSKKLLSLMAKSGCIGITFGVESGSPRILKLIKKNIVPEQIEDAFRWSRDAGIRLLEADVIIGSHPSENMADLGLTKKLLAKIAPDVVMVSIIVPYPGTEVYDIMANNKLIFDDRKWDSFILYGKEPSWRTEHFSPAELMSIQRKMLWGFYFRPSYMLRMLGKMKSPQEIIYWMRGGASFFMNCVRGAFKIRQGE